MEHLALLNKARMIFEKLLREIQHQLNILNCMRSLPTNPAIGQKIGKEVSTYVCSPNSLEL